ncbi:hypothetical protein Ccar_16290 [Clostridium carboxidivorans P7]|uniref:Uncharacterized protein n=1 Tax=Clostridium carboxidivorans P7 TaxID=536227 RepID=C6PT08_9CLOT|nr:hypothetical protein [Clostridium carboxidivorans]AKN32337.1 hypothetical protein Ccar_16290 [Clostridium carboxidivorans P7]EET87643.1 hypothetical protein CcarbDRAFT_1925 [Clostridium carboxidivorans P7]
MKCKNLIKENHNVYMIDGNNFKLDLENDSVMQKYEKVNSVNIINVVNNFLKTQDEHFNKIISSIEELVEKYGIDYFMFGEGKQVSIENLALIYNLKNRNSCVDCNLKVFYNDGRYSNDSRVSYMIEFSEGSSGDNYGFSFYRYFKYSEFYKIENMLEEYFSSDSDGIEDRKAINKCVNNIKNRLDYYYSK